MKLLNEANLVYFSTCSSQTTKEGWLYKKGEVNKNFQKRWFVLKGNLLFYFDKPGDREPNGVIILEGYTVELVDTHIDGFTFQIAFKGASNARRYIIQAESQHVMEQWMKAITCASYDYMRLMVAELKSQLDDLTAQELTNELADCKTRPASTGQHSTDDIAGVHSSKNCPPAVQATLLAGFEPPRIEHVKHRKNPFDAAIVQDFNDLDLFGQVPFNPTNSTKLHPPEAPSRKKTKNSPRMSRKNASPKTSKKNPQPLAQSSAKFYEDAHNYFKDSPLPSTIVSRFIELHAAYGGQIKDIIKSSSNKSASSADNADVGTLINL